MSKFLNLEDMKRMSTEDIITLYRNGYILDNGINTLSPCAVNSISFTKNGSIPSGCTATLADKIGITASVTFASGDAGKSYYCWFDFYKPDKSTGEFFTSPQPTLVSAAGTYTFTFDLPATSVTQTGVYQLLSCYIYDSTNPEVSVCNMYPAIGTCTSLTIAAAPPATASMGTGIIVIGAIAAAVLLFAMKGKK